jgi:DEAD/DEAH box helicase domain-containing protein
MLPLQQAYEVKHSILEYLKATFSFKDRKVHDAFYKFITDENEGIFKGPYISLKLPFVSAPASEEIPLEVIPPFRPYDHQYKSFRRLHTQGGHQPKSTLITTGTSSGKTECFLFPILDYCYKNLHRRGIKVIILYPMNALASDQAKRLAETIWNDPRLKGKVTAGLFIGEGKEKKKFPQDMGDVHVIENKDSIVDSPPDILLTNFKMLDYALMRSQYHNLWTFNLDDPSLLQFLVLDELHTYDGAQGTDVANLVRRLKLKLHIERGQLCAVGTSATIGSGDDSKALLIDYATKVFGESFDQESVITEHRQSVQEFFNIDEDQLEAFIPRQIGLLESRLRENETYAEYIKRQKRLWQLPENIDNKALGSELKKLRIIRDLISITSSEILTLEDLMGKLAAINPDFRQRPEWDEANQLSPREEIIQSILALISEAKVGEGKEFPFLYLQIQIWIRELTGVLREVGTSPKFTWKDKVGGKYDPKALPSYFCRECGASGWLGVKDDNKNHFYSDPLQVYEYFFSNHKNVFLLNTEEHRHIEEYEPTNVINEFLNPVDLALRSKPEEDYFLIQAVRKLRDNKSRHICPECNTENTLGIIGTRVATLSSITVSQVLASDLDPRTEKYRKVLAFTNSVQDAAHQAGFIEARNYRFTFRSSLQKVINEVGRDLNLLELQNEFVSYWKKHSDESGQNQEDAYYYRFFPADYKARADINTDYRIGKKFTDAFKKEFDLRMGWEVVSEFGFNASIGRTLEKTGSAAVSFDRAKLGYVFVQLKDWLSSNNLSVIEEAQFNKFINGILHRMRIRGAIDHPYYSKFRAGDLKLWDLNWMRDNRHFLNRYFGTRARLPKLVTTKLHNRGVLDSSYTNANNWYRSYFMKSFPLASHYNALVNEFYSRLFEILVTVGILDQSGEEENLNYAIRPHAILVGAKVVCHTCNTCSSILNTSSNDAFSEGAPCLNYSCPTGVYVQQQNVHPNYYQLVYNRNRSPRIYAAEHTGILERKDRESKESDFKDRPLFNSLNALVATSTLEMGINIGTLNTAINNSVPPLTSNYLQRVGRAGRESGSALITNFAQGKPHDLFYYEEPLDMMDGDISTPGCYLEAKDILFRHFFAYCLDNWASEDPRNNTLPGRLISMRLMSADLSQPDFLSNRIINYIKSKESILLNRFVDFYRLDLDDTETLSQLQRNLINETFYARIRKVFERLKDEYQDIHEKRKEIDRIIKENKLAETDEERKLLEAEKKALWGLKRALDKRALLEHLTNIGLLPNYAFPETGVTLNAWVKAFQAKASNSIPSDHQFEIVRSSTSAIRELAPGNYFYSQGYRFSVTGLNTFDWKDSDILIQKRFCSSCDHIADAVKSTESHCPKCGDSSWSSARNKHVFVKMNGVKSNNLREKATLDDNKDERNASQYRISRHIKFDQNSFQGAWGMKDIPFGIEYIKNVDLTEVNLGLSSANDANRITINSIDQVPFHGFVTCKYCGKSSSEPHRGRFDPNFSFHYGFCKHRDKDYSGASDGIFEEVYLFREMKTEALKVLLPVQEFEGEAQVNMFKAGLELGLKKYYKGNPQHLNIVDYREYNAQNLKSDRYLVIYDVIPGGTGYLEKLFNPFEFTEVISNAYVAIRDCNCQFQGKDGCYRCIYTYSNQRIQSELSRSKSEELFKKILDKSAAWENFNSGLGALSGNGQIEESELEDRFIRAIKNYLEDRRNENCQFDDYIEDGIVHYRFTISHGDSKYHYVIRPQIELGPSDGVRFRTRSDFYITLVGAEINGNTIQDINVLSSAKDIAVYLDGYTYHATKENLRFFGDLEKRTSIIESGSRITWTITWSDLEKFESIDKESKRDSLYLDRTRYAAAIGAYKKIPYWREHESPLLDSQNTMDRLFWFLMNPFEGEKRAKKCALLLSLMQDQFGIPSLDIDDMDNEILLPFKQIDKGLRTSEPAKGNFFIIPNSPIAENDFVAVKLGVRLQDLHAKCSIGLLKSTDKLNKETWESFWQLFNLIQVFEPKTIDGQTQENYSEAMNDKEQEILKYHDPSLHFIIKQLLEHNIEFPAEGGFFIEVNGEYAEAMLGFAKPKLFIQALSEKDRNLFIAAGYIELKPEDFHISLLQL